MKKNVILIMSDSLRRDHVGCYGNSWIRTPSLDHLAESAMVFDRAYIASYPTIPNRTDLYTGRYGFAYRGWQPLERDDVILPEIVAPHGYTSALVFDTPPLGALDYNYMRGFDSWQWVRGQLADRYITDPRVPTPIAADGHKVRSRERTEQYLRNQSRRRYEKDYLAPRTITAAMEWLEDNHTLDGFLLWVDTWDPHGPFDPPPHYLALYDEPKYAGQHIIFPQYGRCDYMTPEERQHVRALYAGEVTMVDTWIGYLLDTVERLGLLDRTLILHMSDHGHLFGEHGLQGKPGGQLGTLLETTTRIPTMIRHPDGLGAGQRIQPIVQPTDILPTILEFLKVPIPETVHGKSIWPLIRGEVERLHDHAFSGRFPLGTMYSYTATAFDGWAGPDRITEPLTVTTEEWAFICAPKPWPSHLYNLRHDPDQEHNVIDSHPEVAEELHRALLEFLRDACAAADRIDRFRGETTARSGRDVTSDVTLYLIRDRTGRIIAFPTRGEAEECSIEDSPHPGIEERPLQYLVGNHPKALVRIYHQYYWAEDLI